MNKDSILSSTKKIIGVADENTDFDLDILTSINTVIGILRQMGVGPQTKYFTVVDSSTTWDELIPEKTEKYNMVRMYVPLKVRMLFDPPQNGNLFESMQEMIKELEYRIYIEPVSVVDKSVVETIDDEERIIFD